METKLSLVSVIVTLYNYGEYILECLRSVQEQDYPNFECIVVDDCSTDNGPEFVTQHFCRLDRRFRLIRNQCNMGYGYSKNKGILAAKGEFVRPLDADDKLLHKALSTPLGYFERKAGVDLVHGPALRWYGENDTRGFNEKTYCHAQGRMWRRDVYWRFGLYFEPLRSMGDKEFIYRLGVHPDSPLPRQVHDKRIKQPVAMYRKHAAQMHKVRREKPIENDTIKEIFSERIKQLKREGITRENTVFPDTQTRRVA